MKLRLGLGLSDPPSGPGNAAPTDIALSNATVPEDLAVGLTVGTLSFTDPDAGATGTFTIVTDADNKFDISGTSLIIDHALDYETKTSHDVTIRFTDQGGLTYDETFTITVTNIADETTTPPLDPATVTPVFSGGFDVEPVFGKSNGKGKGQGKTNALASIVYSIGAVAAGTTYIMRYTADLSLLSNQGKDTLVGFGMKDGNNFHMIGLKGNGSSGQDPTTIQGNWNALGSATITDKGTNTNGTQYTGLVKIVFSSDGTKYTYSTGTGSDPDTTVWTAEVTDQSVSNIATLTDAETFGLALFLPASDVGQYSIEIDVWRVVEPKTHTWTAGDSSGTSNTTYTFTSKSLGTASASRRIAVLIGGVASSRTVSSVTVAGVSLSFVARYAHNTVTEELWMGSVPSGTSGNVVVTWDNTNSYTSIDVFACYGLSSNTPIATQTWEPLDFPGKNVTITSVAGGFVIAGSCGLGNNVGRTTTYTTITKRSGGDFNNGNNWGHAAASGDTSGTSYSFNEGVATGGITTNAGVACSF